jgi:suppressor for copper-sensitivity B
MKKKILAIFALFFFVAQSANSASTTWHENQSKGAQVRLIGSFYQKKVDNKDFGDKKLIVALHFKIGSGWKIYGQDATNAYGVGMPPVLDFTGSKNYLKNEAVWPQPKIGEEKIGNNTIPYFYYQDEVILPLKVDIEKIGEPVELTLKLDYGLCKDICIPASESFTLSIPPEIDNATLKEIQKFYPEKIFYSDEKIETTKPKLNYTLSLISAILLAIFGGAILNIMPCVLPILSIKLISLVKHSGTETSKIKLSFLSTIVGILSCFIAFAFLTVAIKFTGNSLGWGLQFQNPYFLIFLIVILMLFIGNLVGVFEINFSQFLATILNKKISAQAEKHNIFLPNFLSGILAVLLATPCSAPFLGVAISFALIHNFFVIFLISLSIGIGFALPYIILFFAPNLVSRLPKPGLWMVQIKQLMAGLLAATAIWLIYVLSHNIGAMPAFLAGALATTILYCFKIKSDFFKFFAFIAAISLTFSMPLTLQKAQEIKRAKADYVWQKFDEIELQRLVIEGKTVVVDITADWCLTCQFNKIRILRDKEVMEKLKGDNIVAMRGDMTKPNEEILNFLRKNSRFAIPFNAVYGPNAKTGLLTSELLTKKELLELIDKAS